MPNSRRRILFTTALGHFNVDVIASMVPILLAHLSRAFHLSNAQIGLAVLSYTAVSALSQPVFGFFADRIGGRLLATLGVLWCGAWMAVAGFAPSYALLVPALMLAGLGSGAYHPQGAVRAALAASGQRGIATSIFFLGGGLGFAVGPLVGAQLLAAQGPHIAGWVVLICLPVAWLVWQAFGDEKKPAGAATPRATSARSWSWLAAAPVLPILTVLLSQGLRAGVMDSFNAYVPKFYLDRGFAPAQYGLITSVVLIGASAGGLIGGYLSDRWNKKVVLSGGLLLATPLAYAFFHSGPETRLLLGFLTGLCLSAPFTPAMLLIQGLMPNRLSTITGLALTFFFLAGGVGTSLTGVLADRIGLAQAMNVSAAAIGLAALISLLVPLRLTATHRAAPAPASSSPLSAEENG